ncbi:MAG: SIS domain-containing protein [Pseudomonadales bacterium]|nr:SIS domain-containing protein [Pseudomonadales bacterium]NRA15698.1 SIS domain-containing protein [Oceanospirillaceae bacterium]
MSTYLNALQRHQDLFQKMAQCESILALLAQQIDHCFDAGGKLFFMGNGGSAADSQHLATEFVVRYKAERAPLAAIALTTDTSLLTAHANDFSFATVFSRQVAALAKPEDIIIGISTSGNSENIIDAIQTAQRIGVKTWAWTGESGGKLVDIADHTLAVPATETARVQEAHIFAGHWLCEDADRRALCKAAAEK